MENTQLFWVQISFVLIFTAILGFIVRMGLRRLEQYPSTPAWAVSLCETTHVPAAWLIWGYGVLLSLKIASHHMDIHIPGEVVANIGTLFFVFTITWILFKWKSKYESAIKKRILNKKGADNDALFFALSKISTIFIIIVASLLVMEIIGIPLTALLAFGGLGGIAVGLAAKDVIGNLFGGLMIHINRPFVVGDTISSSNKNFEGVVEQIGWYNTQIRTLDRRPTYIPNGMISEAIIENTGRMYNRQIKEVLGVRYEDADKVPLIVTSIEKMLQDHGEIDQEQNILVDLVSYGESALIIEVSCFTKTIHQKEWRKIRQDILLRILKIITEQGAEVPYSITTVKLQH